MKASIRIVAISLLLSITVSACQTAEPGESQSTVSLTLTSSQSESLSGGSSTMTEPTTEDSTTETTTNPEETTTNPENPYPDVSNQPTTWTRTLDDETYNLAGISEVRNVGLITGDASPNRTRERFQVGGTDLGIPAWHNDKLYLFFGDTFRGDDEGHPMAGGGWRSNVLAYTSDTDYANGLDLEAFIVNSSAPGSYAKEIISSRKSPGIEHTVIPTGAVSSGENLYAYFMSVKEWGDPGRWTINYGGLAKSTDDGQTFTKLDDIRFDGDAFGQVSPLQIDDMIYLVGIGGGRYGDLYLMRVPEAEIENFAAYEYFTGMDGAAASFSSDVNEREPVADGPIGEPSIMYNRYLEEYVLLYLDESRAAIVMRVAKDLWGPWSTELDLISSRDFPSLYGGFTHGAMTSDDGQTFYFTMSMWDPIYNSLLIEVKLDRR